MNSNGEYRKRLEGKVAIVTGATGGIVKPLPSSSCGKARM
jgi:hypothetical protein